MIADNETASNSEREKAREFLKLKDQIHAEGQKRWIEKPDVLDAEDDAITTILAASLVAALKDGRRIAIGRINDTEEWAVVPASNWADDWKFLKMSNRVVRETPFMTIEDIRIVQPDALKANVSRNHTGRKSEIQEPYDLWKANRAAGMWQGDGDRHQKPLQSLTDAKKDFYDFCNDLFGEKAPEDNSDAFEKHVRKNDPQFHKILVGKPAK